MNNALSGDAPKVDQSSLPNVDDMLSKELRSIAKNHVDFWTFRRGSVRAGEAALYQYPAMMVPDMPRVIIGLLRALQGDALQHLLDPFVGSGTVIREGMVQGLHVSGYDINPLAILLSEVKGGPLNTDELEEAVLEVLAASRNDLSCEISVDFPGRDKWFREDVSIILSRIRRAILLQPELWVRKLLWVTLSETIRLTSNSRTSTYKLHIRPLEELRAGGRDPLALFERLAVRTLDQVRRLRDELRQYQLLNHDRYRNTVSVALQDARDLATTLTGNRMDLVVTSPPYGDNTSTVPYGQSSYLPLQWIEFKDIGSGNIDPECLRTTSEIDRRSLGGRSDRDLKELVAGLVEKSSSFKNIVDKLHSEPPDRLRRVARFFSDLDQSLASLSLVCRPNAYMVWTVGNRRVADHEIRLDQVLVDLMAHHRVGLVHALDREIVSKRMAGRNSIASTMGTEKIMFFRKG